MNAPPKNKIPIIHVMAYFQPKRNIDLASCMATDAYKHVRQCNGYYYTPEKDNKT